MGSIHYSNEYLITLLAQRKFSRLSRLSCLDLISQIVWKYKSKGHYPAILSGPQPISEVCCDNRHSTIYLSVLSYHFVSFLYQTLRICLQPWQIQWSGLFSSSGSSSPKMTWPLVNHSLAFRSFDNVILLRYCFPQLAPPILPHFPHPAMTPERVNRLLIEITVRCHRSSS